MLDSNKYMVSSDPVKKEEMLKALAEITEQLKHSRTNSNKHAKLIAQQEELKKQFPANFFNEGLFLKEVKEYISRLADENDINMKKIANSLVNNPTYFIQWHANSVIVCHLRQKMYVVLKRIIDESTNFNMFVKLFEEYQVSCREHLLRFTFMTASSPFENAVNITEHQFYKENFGTALGIGPMFEIAYAISYITNHLEKGGKVIEYN